MLVYKTLVVVYLGFLKKKKHVEKNLKMSEEKKKENIESVTEKDASKEEKKVPKEATKLIIRKE